MSILGKDILLKWIVPNLILGKRGRKLRVPVLSIVEAILYRLKTGCQWRELPMRQFFGDTEYGWNSVFQHFNRWCAAGCWQKAWIVFLKAHRHLLRLDSASLDGSHTPAKRGGEAAAYQERKACVTTNALFLCDSQGVMLTMGEPQAGNHHDLHGIESVFAGMLAQLEAAEIGVDGLFLNADAGFDSAALKQQCATENIHLNVKPNPRNKKNPDRHDPYASFHVFDELLHKNRTTIEHANAWLDAFKAILLRFETLARNWQQLHYIAFFPIFIRKFAHKNFI